MDSDFTFYKSKVQKQKIFCNLLPSLRVIYQPTDNDHFLSSFYGRLPLISNEIDGMEMYIICLYPFIDPSLGNSLEKQEVHVF